MTFKVLLLEDDASQASDLQQAFAQRSWDVTVLSSADEGLWVAGSDRFDLILLSAELPGGNGFELCNEIKKDPIAARVPIFVMSSGSSHDDLASLKQRGINAEGFFRKPVIVADLLARMPAKAMDAGRPQRISTGVLELMPVDELEGVSELEEVAEREEHPALDPGHVRAPPRPHRPPSLFPRSAPPVTLKAIPARALVEQRETITKQERLIASLHSELAVRTQATRRFEERKEDYERAIEAAAELEVERATDAARHARELAQLKSQHPAAGGVSEQEHAGALAERDRVHAEAAGLAAKRVQELERAVAAETKALATERKSRGADAQEHALALLAQQQKNAEERAQRERAVASQLAERDDAVAAGELNAAQQLAESMQLLGSELASEREGRAAEAAVHAQSLAAARDQWDEELAELVGLQEAATVELNVAHAAALAAQERALATQARAHAAELATLENARVGGLGERERVHAEALGVVGQRLRDVERTLASEREGRAADAAAHAELLSLTKQNRIDELAERDRLHAEERAASEHAHAEVERERARAHADELARR